MKNLLLVVGLLQMTLSIIGLLVGEYGEASQFGALSVLLLMEWEKR